MKTYLKIKIKSLAAEAVMIKREEGKWKKRPWLVDNQNVHHPLFWSLKSHRIHEVRTESRSAIIAYGYLRGRSYKQIEAKCHQQPNWARIEALIAKYARPAVFSAAERKQLSENLKAWAKGEALQQAA